MRIFNRADLEHFAEVAGVTGDLGKLTDAKLLDLLTAALVERQAAIKRADPGGPAVPRYSGGER